MPTSTDARDVMEDHFSTQEPLGSSGDPYTSHGRPTSARPNYRYETTADGDIVVHDPVFSPEGSSDAQQQQHQPLPPPSFHQHQHHYQQHSQHPQQHAQPLSHYPPHLPPASGWPSQELRKPSSMKRPGSHGRHHSRNLSAHFFDATKISGGDNDDQDEAQVAKNFFAKAKEAAGGNNTASTNAGQKHRRMFSGDVSNPALAHRRINSIGNAAAVDRFLQRPRGRHRREDSAGLDILSAVADVTNDELADAAGARTTSVWEGGPPGAPLSGPPPTTHAGYQHHNRLSSLDYFEYGSTAPGQRPPPGAPGGMQPPPPRGYHAPPLPGHGYGAPPPPPIPPPPPGQYSHHPHPHHPPPPPTLSYHHHGPYPPHSSYYPPPPTGHPAARPAYPVQYSRHAPLPPPSQPPHQMPSGMYKPPAHGSAPIATPMYAPARPLPPLEESSGRQPSPTAQFRGDEKIQSDERLFGGREGSSEQYRRSSVTSTGSTPSQSNSEIMDTAEPLPPPRAGRSHHRKLSSFASMDGLMGSSIFSPGGGGMDNSDQQQHPLKKAGRHHRATSSSVSFLQGLDVLEGSDVMFLRNLHASTPHYGGPPPLGAPPATTTATSHPGASSLPPPLQPLAPESRGHSPNDMDHLQYDDDDSKLAAGGTSKRVRRKCTVANCPNRVVQGGLCISHGAKRKTCKHPGCEKNVKKAGLCSTHGPARRRCDHDGCNKVAVQAGRCIAHGAKKKMCAVDNCQKQAILSGMCKKHHDKLGGLDPNDPALSVAIDGKLGGPAHKPGHTRGLSIFQDLSADAVQNLLAGDDPLAL